MCGTGLSGRLALQGSLERTQANFVLPWWQEYAAAEFKPAAVVFLSQVSDILNVSRVNLQPPILPLLVTKPSRFFSSVHSRKTTRRDEPWTYIHSQCGWSRQHTVKFMWTVVLSRNPLFSICMLIPANHKPVVISHVSQQYR